MDIERRQSMRVSARLPCQWQSFEEMPRRRDLIDCFALPQVALEAAELRNEVERELKAVADKTLRRTLALLNQRIDLLAATSRSAPTPPPLDLELSADGVCLPTASQLAAGSWVGVHVLLDDNTEFLAAGRVCHSTRVDGQPYRTGVSFADAEDCRVLARHVMRSARSQGTSD